MSSTGSPARKSGGTSRRHPVRPHARSPSRARRSESPAACCPRRLGRSARARQVVAQEAGAGAGYREGDVVRESTCWRGKAGDTERADAATVAAAPSRLSIRLNALTIPTTQRIVSSRSAASPGKDRPAEIASPKNDAARTSAMTRTRRRAKPGHRLSQPPRAPRHRRAAARDLCQGQSVRDQPPQGTRKDDGYRRDRELAPRAPCSPRAIHKAGRVGDPDRRLASRAGNDDEAAQDKQSYRVNAWKPLRPPGVSSRAATCAAALHCWANCSSSSLNPAGLVLLVGDHVVDGLVDRARRLPAGGVDERGDVRHPPAELLEARGRMPPRRGPA